MLTSGHRLTWNAVDRSASPPPLGEVAAKRTEGAAPSLYVVLPTPPRCARSPSPRGRGEALRTPGSLIAGSFGLLLWCGIACTVPLSNALAAEALPPGAASCFGCHGGGTEDPRPLSSLSPDDIAAALAAYRSGERQGTIMPRLAKGFSDAEARAIAAAVGRGGPAAR